MSFFKDTEELRNLHATENDGQRLKLREYERECAEVFERLREATSEFRDKAVSLGIPPQELRYADGTVAHEWGLWHSVGVRDSGEGLEEPTVCKCTRPVTPQTLRDLCIHSDQSVSDGVDDALHAMRRLLERG